MSSEQLRAVFRIDIAMMMRLIKHLYSFGHMGFVPLACITPNGPTRPSAIAARGSFARYNLNSWLEIRGALQDFIDSEVFALRRTAKPTWVAEINRQIVGFADLEPDGHVDMLFVHAEHQGKGIARALLAHIENMQCSRVLIGFTPKPALPRGQHLNAVDSGLSPNKLLQCEVRRSLTIGWKSGSLYVCVRVVSSRYRAISLGYTLHGH
jgi:GNAT superfamily N-acetyltransferase